MIRQEQWDQVISNLQLRSCMQPSRQVRVNSDTSLGRYGQGQGASPWIRQQCSRLKRPTGILGNTVSNHLRGNHGVADDKGHV